MWKLKIIFSCSSNLGWSCNYLQIIALKYREIRISCKLQLLETEKKKKKYIALNKDKTVYNILNRNRK